MRIAHAAGASLPVVLASLAPCVVAVSGGVDSLLLAVVAGRVLRDTVVMAHAAGPAVPPDDTARVRETAAAEGWNLRCVAAGELDDPDYVRNPVDRCFFCKSRLYAALCALGGQAFPAGRRPSSLEPIPTTCRTTVPAWRRPDASACATP